MVKLEEIKERVKKYLQEKCNLDIPSCYAVTKDMMEDYWDEWRNFGENDEQVIDDFKDFEGITPQPMAYHPTQDATIAQNQANLIVPNLHKPELPIQVV